MASVVEFSDSFDRQEQEYILLEMVDRCLALGRSGKKTRGETVEDIINAVMEWRKENGWK